MSSWRAERGEDIMTYAQYPSLAGRSVLVTGGASGIGAAIVDAFVGQRARVGVLDIDAEAGQRLSARHGSAVYVEHVDIRDIAALRAAVERTHDALGPLTVLVNNAARDDRHKMEDVTPEYWRERLA